MNLHSAAAPDGRDATTVGKTPSPELAGDLAFELVRTLKLLYVMRDRLPRVAPALDPAAQPLLHRLAKGDNSRVSDLAACMHVDVSTVSRYASNLAAAGLIEKASDPADRRVQQLSLTDAGRAAVASMRQQRAEVFARILSDWTPDEVHTFRTLLNRFASAVEQDLERTNPDAPASA